MSARALPFDIAIALQKAAATNFLYIVPSGSFVSLGTAVHRRLDLNQYTAYATNANAAINFARERRK
jgi:hypothetical protein